MRADDIADLKGTELLSTLGDSSFQGLVEGGLVQRLPPGAVLFEEGNRAEFLHVVLAGRIALTADGPDDREAVIEIFAAGEVLIAPAVILDLPYLVSARVTEEARVAMLPAANLRRAMATDPAAALAMSQILARHWRILVTQIKELKLRSTTERIGSYLLGQLDAGDGPQTIRLSEDRGTMASRLGMSPESLSRAFAQLRQIGISGRGRTVVVAEPEKLRMLCRSEDR